MKCKSHHRSTHQPDTCGSCAFFISIVEGRYKGTGRCHCWHVKSKDGDYVARRNDDQACGHYMSEQASWAPISY